MLRVMLCFSGVYFFLCLCVYIFYMRIKRVVATKVKKNIEVPLKSDILKVFYLTPGAINIRKSEKKYIDYQIDF